MTRYFYDGPVLEFNNLLMDHFKAETVAPSESKARNNLAYQFKKKYNRLSGAKITLPGVIVAIE